MQHTRKLCMYLFLYFDRLFISAFKKEKLLSFRFRFWFGSSSIRKIKEQFGRNSVHPPFHPVKTYRKRKYREQEIKTVREELEIEHSNYFLIRENLVSTFPQFPPFSPIDDVTFDEKTTSPRNRPTETKETVKKKEREREKKRARIKQKGAETRLEGKQDVERDGIGIKKSGAVRSSSGRIRIFFEFNQPDQTDTIPSPSSSHFFSLDSRDEFRSRPT